MPEISYGGLVDSVSLPITAEIRESQWVAIDIQIDARSNLVGKADYGKYVPRLWSGYWYLSRNESICKNGSIEFQRMRIYEHRYPSLTHALNDAYAAMAMRLLDYRSQLVLNQNFKPRDLEMLAYTWAIGAQVFAAADGLCYEIMPHPIDKLLLYIPAGVELTVTFRWEPYCEMLNINPDPEAPDLFVSEPTEPTTPTETLNPSLDIVPPSQTFDEFVRSKGYIPVEECGIPPVVGSKSVTVSYSWTGTVSGSTSKTFVVPANASVGSPSISNTRYTATGASGLYSQWINVSGCPTQSEIFTSFPGSGYAYYWIGSIAVSGTVYGFIAVVSNSSLSLNISDGAVSSSEC
jgi:hypothetical protein